jgi:hypothetical protein
MACVTNTNAYMINYSKLRRNTGETRHLEYTGEIISINRVNSHFKHQWFTQSQRCKHQCFANNLCDLDSFFEFGMALHPEIHG